MSEKIHTFINSQQFKTAAIVLGFLFIVLLAFAGGVRVGFHKAKFSSAFDRHYEQNFTQGMRGDDMDPDGRGGHMMRPRGSMMGMGGGDYRNGHGTAGEVISVSGGTIIIKNKENQETSVGVSDTTILNHKKDAIALADIKTGDRLVVVGKPGDDGVIDAQFIRVFQATDSQQ